MSLRSIQARARRLHPAFNPAVEGGHGLSYQAPGPGSGPPGARRVGPGCRVALFLPHSVPCLEYRAAPAGPGGIPVGLNLQRHPDDAGFSRRHVGAAGLIAEAGLARPAGGPPESGLDCPALSRP